MREKLIQLIGDSYNEEFLTFCCDDVIAYIKNYCNLTEVPIDAEYVAVKMAYDLYNKISNCQVKSITRGDFSVTYSEKLESYNSELYPFRKLRW